MKKIFSSHLNNDLNHLWLLLFRVVISVLLITHGITKLEMLLSGNGAQFPDPLGIGNLTSLILAITGELVAPVFIIAGFGTRLAAIPSISTMAVAAFIVHSGDPLQKKELALMFLAGFLTILFLGAGRFSLDGFLSRKK